MNRFAEITDGKIGHIYIQKEKPVFAPYIKLINITDIKPLPDIGWFYDEASNSFSEANPSPPIIEQTLDEKVKHLEELSLNNNLVTIDAILSVYEEVLALREEVNGLKNSNYGN